MFANGLRPRLQARTGSPHTAKNMWFTRPGTRWRGTCLQARLNNGKAIQIIPNQPIVHANDRIQGTAKA